MWNIWGVSKLFVKNKQNIMKKWSYKPILLSQTVISKYEIRVFKGKASKPNTKRLKILNKQNIKIWCWCLLTKELVVS